MHLFYYDEVKNGPQQPAYWLGGICAAGTSIRALEESLSDIAEEFFQSRDLSKATEFHGVEIVHGKGNWKGRDFNERLAALEKILKILTREDVFRICIKILPENFVVPKEPDEVAFMYLIEQVESLFVQLDTVGMMFGDYDEPNVGRSVASLSGYRRGGTDWAQGRGIERIVDTVHFARSHHSRMVQLADVYLYCKQFSAQPNQAPWRRCFADLIWASGIQASTRSKIWPAEKVWYR